MFICLGLYIILKKNYDLFLEIIKEDLFKMNVDFYFKHCYLILVHLNFDFSIKLIEGGKND